MSLAPPALARGDGTCHSWLGAESLGAIELEDLDEVSGMAFSHENPDVIWVHNDSGGEARLFPVSPTGWSYGSHALLGAENQDWEDLALGPCPDDDSACACLYTADIGSNDGTREEGVIYRVAEPVIDAISEDSQSDLVEEIWFRYPDGPHDAEALVVHPDTGEVFILTKEEDDTSGVYVFPDAPLLPYDESDPVELELWATLDLSQWDLEDTRVTGADASPRGTRVAIRTEEDLILLSASATGALPDAFLGDPVTLPPTPEGEGEAVAFSADGESLYLVDEGATPEVWQVRCADFESDGGSDWDPLADCDDRECGCHAGRAPARAGLAGGLALLLLAWGRRTQPGSRGRPAPGSGGAATPRRGAPSRTSTGDPARW